MSKKIRVECGCPKLKTSEDYQWYGFTGQGRYITGNFYSSDCVRCKGSGIVERELKAEDLSLEEQHRILDSWTDHIIKTVEDWDNPDNEWEGLK